MPNGDKPKSTYFQLDNVNKRRVPGLRDIGFNSECKVYKIIDGVKTLVRVERE